MESHHRYSSSDDERISPKNSKSRDGGGRRRSSSRSGSVSKSRSHHRYSSPDRSSPPPYSSSKHKSSQNSSESSRRDRVRDRRYDSCKLSSRKYRHSYSSHKHDLPRSRSRSRSRRRSRSRSLSRRSSPKRSHRDHSPKRSADRSPRRKHFDSKSNKLSILEKMGIDLKVPENEQGGTSSILPSYYNPLTVNPVKYAQQLAKRKLLWKNAKTDEKKEEATKNVSIWQGAKFSQDVDGKLTAKFQRLMGMKEGAIAAPQGTPDQEGKVKDLFKKQEELFSSMEMQYEVARATTHTQRGVGLGFGPRHIP